jgi:hypothetical protein
VADAVAEVGEASVGCVVGERGTDDARGLVLVVGGLDARGREWRRGRLLLRLSLLREGRTEEREN